MMDFHKEERTQCVCGDSEYSHIHYITEYDRNKHWGQRKVIGYESSWCRNVMCDCKEFRQRDLQP